MRIWHYSLLPYLPELQFKGQLRELMAIMRDWRDKGQTNHILINRVTEYPKSDLVSYFVAYEVEFFARYGVQHMDKLDQFTEFLGSERLKFPPFVGWHDRDYLRVCMANLYEKHKFGLGKSRITDKEWSVLLDGYKKITNEDYEI